MQENKEFNQASTISIEDLRELTNAKIPKAKAVIVVINMSV